VLSPTDLTVDDDGFPPFLRPPLSPGESRYGSTITLPETFPEEDDPPANSALIYVRESGGLTQLVARFADGEIDVLAEEAP
jgi:hypothetical protein